MVNPLKGEVELTVGDETYVMSLTANSIVAIETVLDSDITSIVETMSPTPRMGTLRAVLWGALRSHNPEITLLEVGDLIDEMGNEGMETLGAKLGEAIRFRLSGADGAKPKRSARK